MNRRDFLAASASTAAALAIARCAGTRPPASRRGPPDIRRPDGCALAPVRVSAEREIRTIAGLRPYRPSGFVVRAEKSGDVLVIHNYGHGGGGITLSWGTSKLAIDRIPPEHRGPVAVLGCGAVGLSAARLLQERGYPVTIYAKDLPPNTTSNVAGGQWFPFFVYDSSCRTPEFLRQFVAASEFAYRRYQTMVGSRYGVRWMRNYSIAREPFSETGLVSTRGPIGALLPELRDLPPNEHPFPDAPFVRQFDGMLIEPPLYLAAMLEDFRVAGGVVRVVEIGDRSQLASLPERVVINCTGLGSRSLFGDEELVPVRGQLTFLLPQPEVSYAVLRGDLYMFPRRDGIVLGGTHGEGITSLEPDLPTKDRILADHKRFFDGFRSC